MNKEKIQNYLENINYKNIIYYILGLSIFAIALRLRLYPARYDSLQAIDPFYLSRMTETVINNGLHVPDMDPLRYYHTGFNPRKEGFMLYYVYGIIYLILKTFISIDFQTYAKIIPAVFGALITIPIYFLGKEMKDRKTGIIAAFLYSTSSAVLFRTSAGFFEKEPLGGLFIFITAWFVFRSLRTNSLIDASIAGMSLLYASLIWGGTNSLYLVLTGAFGLMILSGKYPKSLIKTYGALSFFTIIMALVYVRYELTDAMVLGFVGLYIILLGIEYYRLKYNIDKKELTVKIPVLFGALILILFISSLFSSFSAKIVKRFMNYLFMSKGVIGSTVAENVGASWGDFINRLGTPYIDPLLKSYGWEQLSFIKYISSPWIWAFIGSILIIYITYRNKNNTKNYYIALIFNIISIFSMYGYLTNTSNPAKQSLLYSVYVIAFIISNFLVIRENYKYGLILSFYYATILAFFIKVRIVFLTGPFVILLASFAFSYVLDKLWSLYKKYSKDEYVRHMILALYIGLIILFIFGNLASGYVLASKAIGPSYNNNWKEAMEFLRTNTSEDAVILSWWDFGYWFQTEGHRATLLDGGNVYGQRNVEAARYFTGYYNTTEQLEYLKKWHPTHILVDASMIGKYAAMSKIANEGKKVDSYMGMNLIEMIPKDNNVVVYKYGAYNVFYLYIPINQSNGALAGEIKLMDARVGNYPIPIKYICTPRGYEIASHSNESSDSCIVFGGRTVYLASPEIRVSPFNKIYVMDGYDMDYLNKVFDNGEIKIFEINYTKIDEDLDRLKMRAENSTLGG